MSKNYISIMVVLMAVVLMILPVSATNVGTIVQQGATVFIGEEGLDISQAVGDSSTIGWWASAADLTTTSPSQTITVTGRNKTFEITQSEFLGHTGSWYKVKSDGTAGDLVFMVSEPRTSVSIRNAGDGLLTSLDGKTVTSGTPITFKIDTNVILNKRGDVSAEVFAPVADFTATVNPVNGSVTFTPATTGGTPTNYRWTFSDDGVVTAQTYVHAPASSYTATLEVYNAVNSGGSATKSTMTKTITITDPTYSGSVVVGSPSTPNPSTDPYASFSGVVSNTGYVVLSGFSTGATTWDWTFGDGNVSNVQNPPPYQYSPITGTHTIRLSVTDGSTVTPSRVDGIVTVTSTPYTVSVTSPVLISPVPVSATSIVPASTGYIDIIVKADGGATYTSLYNVTGGTQVSLKDQFISSSPYYWNSGSSPVSQWNTGAKSVDSQRIYQNGVYSVYVECNLNGMKDNYNVVGKSVSETKTVTLGSDTLMLEVSKNSVVRGKPFAVTVTGQPNANYKLSFKGLSTSVIAPKVTEFQEGVTTTSTANTWNVVTDSSGKRTVEFTTYSETKEQKYTIRVESYTSPVKSDEVAINVVKGGMTLTATGNQNYYLGEEIKFSGTNTESDFVYMFVTGPNLNSNGENLETGEAVYNNDDTTFTDANVEGDDTFTYEWQTSNADLDAGTYTVYAVSTPNDKSHLQDSSYATVSISIKKPFVSAKVSQPNIAKGDRVFVEGTAEGDPSSGVQIWILGKNYVKIVTQSVDSDSTYKYEMTQGDTSDMASGQYFIVVQHPMQNGVFDIYRDGDFVINNELGSGTSLFKLTGSGSLQGSDAAEALIQAINDPNIDDTYTKLNVMVEEPLIIIDPIGAKSIGDKFTLTGKTNLAVDDEILIEIYSSSFKPTDKSQNGEFSGTTGTVKVLKSESGLNKFSLDIDTATFKADEYIVVAQGITQESSGTTLFTVQAMPVTTPPTPTPVVTAPTAAPLTVPPTAPPTEVPTPIVTETTKSPGFGAILALVGLMGVAFVVVRRS